MHKLIFPLLTIIVLIAAIPVSAQSPLHWNTYQNARFGYEIEYPQTFRKTGVAPENDDGRNFSSQDGIATLTVYGSFNALGRALSESYEEKLESCRNENKKVTYKSQGKDWFVISGLDGNKVFYMKTLRRKAGNEPEVDATFIITYPGTSKKIYDAVTEHISKNLRFVKAPL